MYKRFISKLTVLAITCMIVSSFAFSAEITKAQVLDIVDDAVKLVEMKGDAGIKIIGTKDGEFKKGALYVFCYNTDVEIIAHPVKPFLVGKSYKGKPDVKGKKFRDEIVKKALDGSGWTTYHYQKPGAKGIFKKTAFSRLAKYNGKKYIVVAGMYAAK